MNQPQWQPGNRPQPDYRGEQNPFAGTPGQAAWAGASPAAPENRGVPVWVVIVLAVVILALGVAMAVALFGQRLWAGGAGDGETADRKSVV